MNTNITERVQKVLAGIRAKRARIEKATKAPWVNLSDQPRTWLGTEAGKCVAELDSHDKHCTHDLAFITDARTTYPLTLDMLEASIEGLLRITRQVPITASRGEYREGQLHAIEAESKHATDALTTLCDQWEAGRCT